MWVGYVFGWKKHYFVLRGDTLEYRKVKEGANKATVLMPQAHLIPNAGSPNKFKVYSGLKTLHLKAYSTEDAKRWVAALLSAQIGIVPRELNSELPKAAAIDLRSMTDDLASLHEQISYITDELHASMVGHPITHLASEFREVSGFVVTLINRFKEVSGVSPSNRQQSGGSYVSSTGSVDFQDAVSVFDDDLFQDAAEYKTSRVMCHRNGLPVQRNPSQKINIWKVIKDSIGKDLTRIAVPVYFNEPMSFIQRFSEELTYSDLLKTANAITQPELRMAYVAAFTISSYATTINRTMKPFNPILGETFQLERDGFRLVSEQVSHHPPITALHSEAPEFLFYGSVEPKTKFKGSHMLVHCNGSLQVRLLSWDEEYTWTKPNTTVHNIIIGQIYIDNNGTYSVTCPATGARADVTFKKAGWFEKSKQEAAAIIYDASGTAKFSLDGKWSEFLDLKDLTTGDIRPVWRHSPLPENSEFYYYFTDYALQLNMPPEMVDFLPQSDSRLRPDQRALENGDIETAASEKHRLEEKQRAAKRQHDQLMTEYCPRWFKFTDAMWRYQGGYWEQKQAQRFTNVPDIF